MVGDSQCVYFFSEWVDDWRLDNVGLSVTSEGKQIFRNLENHGLVNGRDTKFVVVRVVCWLMGLRPTCEGKKQQSPCVVVFATQLTLP